MDSYFIPQRGEETEKFPLASPACLPSSAFTSHVAGDMHDGEGERRCYQVTERDKQQFLSLWKAPGAGGRRVPDGVSLCCTADVSCTLSGPVGHLHPLDGKEQRRGLPPAGAMWARPACPTCHGLWSLRSQGRHAGLSVEGSWCLVPAAASASAALTAAPERRVQGASWNWTR